MDFNRVLIVEDSKAMCAAIASTMQSQYNYQCDIAHSAKEAELLLQEHADKYFASLLDLNLPDAPHGEIVDIVLRHNIPAIVFTANINSDTRSQFWQKGIVDYVMKEGFHNLDYITTAIHRLDLNRHTKILIVDDEKTSVCAIKHLLDIHQFQVFTAESAKHALELYNAIPNIRLIITDSKMPEMDGVGLVKEIRKVATKEKTSVIGISAFNDSHESALFIKAGADDFLHKPLIPEEFYSRINNNLQNQDIISTLKKLNEEKNRFLAIASHDVRSPLSGISSLCELIMDNPEEISLEFIKVISETTGQVTRLINNLLDVSVIESGKFDIIKTNCNVNNIIKRRVTLSQASATKKQIKINSSLVELEPIPCDEERISQLFDNLITNAIKYSEPDSEIFITSKITSKNNLRIEFQDQGQGIAAEKLDGLFEIFTTAGSTPTGGERSTGVGLAIAKKVIEAHGGKIWVESTVGKGSSFFIELPYILKEQDVFAI